MTRRRTAAPLTSRLYLRSLGFAGRRSWSTACSAISAARDRIVASVERLVSELAAGR